MMQDPFFTRRCSAIMRIGAFYARMSYFSKIELYDKYLVVKYGHFNNKDKLKPRPGLGQSFRDALLFRQNIVLKYSEIIDVKTKTGRVLVIDHNTNQSAVTIVSNTSSRKKNDKLISKLKEKGIKITYV